MAIAQAVERRLTLCGLSDDALEQVLALTLGRRNPLQESSQMNLYRAAGVSHVMAISGLHLSVFCAAFAPLVFMVRTKMGPMLLRIIAVYIVLIVVWLYVCVAQMPMSMIRAATMLSIALISALTPLRMRLIDVWLVSVMIILIISPRSAVDVGFQLSSMAMLSIALCCDRDRQEAVIVNGVIINSDNGGWQDKYRESQTSYRILRKVFDVVKEWVKVSFWCQLFTAPLVAHYFGTFIPHAVIVSAFVTAYMSGVLHICFILIVSLFIVPHAVSYALAQSINGLLWAQMEVLRMVTANLGGGLYDVKWSRWAVALWYACIALFIMQRGRQRP